MRKDRKRGLIQQQGRLLFNFIYHFHFFTSWFWGKKYIWSRVFEYLQNGRKSMQLTDNLYNLSYKGLSGQCRSLVILRPGVWEHWSRKGENNLQSLSSEFARCGGPCSKEQPKKQLLNYKCKRLISSCNHTGAAGHTLFYFCMFLCLNKMKEAPPPPLQKSFSVLIRHGPIVPHEVLCKTNYERFHLLGQKNS